MEKLKEIENSLDLKELRIEEQKIWWIIQYYRELLTLTHFNEVKEVKEIKEQIETHLDLLDEIKNIKDRIYNIINKNE